MGFNEYMSSIVSKANKSTNTQEVKAIRNKLIKYGAVAAIVGGVGSAICFVMFVIGGFRMIPDINPGDYPSDVVMEFSIWPILIPFFLFIPFGIVFILGALSIKAGLAIVVTQVGSKFLDENKYCPNCGDIVNPDEDYCDKCGTPLLIDKLCKHCNTANSLDAKFCKKCGKEL